MCARDKEKAFPLNTQKLEPGQDRDAALASHRQNQFLICFWKELSDWFFITCVRKVNLQQRSSQFSSLSQQSTHSGLLLQYASFSGCVPLEHFPQVLINCRTNFHIAQDQMHVSFSAPSDDAESQGLVCRTSHLAICSVSTYPLSSIQKPHCGLVVTDDELKSSVLYCGKRWEVLWKLCTHRALRGPI